MQDILSKGPRVKVGHLEQSRALLATSEKNLSHVNEKGQLISTAKVNWDSFPPFCCCMVQIWGFVPGFSRTIQVPCIFIRYYICAGALQTLAHLHAHLCAYQAGSSFLKELGWSGFPFLLFLQVVSDYSWI